MLLSNHNFVAFHCIMDINYCHITDSRTPILGRVFSCAKKCFDSTFFQKCHVCISSELTNNEYNSPCLCCNTFTGKEKDSETGFYYFGARYYDPSLSGLFLSVDPMADKYPSTSPYAYCAWNPVKLVDQNGDSCIFADEITKQSFYKSYNRITDELNTMRDKGRTRGSNYKKMEKMKECFDEVIGSSTVFYYKSISNKDKTGRVILSGGSTYAKLGIKGICVDFIFGSEESMVHETRHAYGYCRGEWDIDYSHIENEKFGLINYDYMDEFEAYNMGYDFSNLLLKDPKYYDEWTIKSQIINYYGTNSEANGIITEFVQYTKDSPYKSRKK